MNNKKKIIIASIIAVLIASIGVAYAAAMTYSRSGTYTNKLIAGDIYMRYKESPELTYSNAFPTANYVEGKYFEFQIIGKNEYTEKDIIYDVVINHGANHATRTTRIDDKFLRFRLVEVNNLGQANESEAEIWTNKKYSNINNTRIYVARIPAETKTEITKTYRLYMWISNEVGIGTNADYDMDTWNNQVYASIKVNVTGDFNDKELAKPFDEIITTDTLDTGIKFYNVSSSTNGEGLYKMASTASDTYPIYYYRGNVDNNNVYFAESCWKIVRTTSTGGLKLVYNGAATIVDGEKQCNQTTETGTQLSVGTKAFNSSYNSPAYVGYSLPESSKRYSYSTQTLNSTTYYGSSVDQATYKLVDPVLELNDTHHYSYNSDDPDAIGIANDIGNVRYYYNKDSANTTSGKGYFIKFDKTKSVSTILDEMLTESNSKNNPSTIQGVINTWWGTGDNSLNSKYGEYLEDTEWCNDRSIASYGGWSPTGTLYSSNWQDYSIVFNERVRYDQSTFGSDANNIKNTNTPILTCSRPVDRLTVANGNLTYPIGLLTYDEVALAGARWSNGNSNFYLYTNQSYWFLSPSYFGSTSAAVGNVTSSGTLSGYFVNYTHGVRPALSLKHGTQILRGEGTKTKPYIITED